MTQTKKKAPKGLFYGFEGEGCGDILSPPLNRNMAALIDAVGQIREAHGIMMETHGAMDELLLTIPEIDDVNNADPTALPEYAEHVGGIHDRLSELIDAGQVSLMTLQSMPVSDDILALMNGMNDLQNRAMVLRADIAEAMDAADYESMHIRLENAHLVSEELEGRWNEFLEEAEQMVQMGGRRTRKTHRGKTHRGKTHRGKTHRGKTHRGKTHRGKTHRRK
jgi:hypothetical protein